MAFPSGTRCRPARAPRQRTGRRRARGRGGVRARGLPAVDTAGGRRGRVTEDGSDGLERALSRAPSALVGLLFCAVSLAVFFPALGNGYAYDGRTLVARAAQPRPGHLAAFLDP